VLALRDRAEDLKEHPTDRRRRVDALIEGVVDEDLLAAGRLKRVALAVAVLVASLDAPVANAHPGSEQKRVSALR